MLRPLILLSLCMPLTSLSLTGEETAAKQAMRQVAEAYGSLDDQGRRVMRYAQVPEEDRNPWSPEREEAFISHYQKYLDYVQKSPRTKVNTFFENEKKTYGKVMLTRLVGHREATLKALQGEDNQAAAFHQETKGIDYYAAFTIKHQMRKYFWFGDELEPAYRRRMFDGAKLWTAQEPLRRPHYAYNPQKRDQGWGPDARKLGECPPIIYKPCATPRCTSAEETGNEETRQIYLKRLRAVQSLYAVMASGIRTTISAALAPYHTLYDFAKDREVRLLAKAAKDWLYTTAALKYGVVIGMAPTAVTTMPFNRKWLGHPHLWIALPTLNSKIIDTTLDIR